MVAEAETLGFTSVTRSDQQDASSNNAEVTLDSLPAAETRPKSQSSNSGSAHFSSGNPRDNNNSATPTQGFRASRQASNPSKRHCYPATFPSIDTRSAAATSLNQQNPPTPISPNLVQDSDPSSHPGEPLTEKSDIVPWTTCASTKLPGSTSYESAGAAAHAAAVASIHSPPPSNPHSRESSHQLSNSPSVIDSSAGATDQVAQPSDHLVSNPDPTSTKPTSASLHLQLSAALAAVNYESQSGGNQQAYASQLSGETRSQDLSPRKYPQESSDSPRELLLLKSVAQQASTDERRASYRPPPVSYKPLTASTATSSGASTPVRVPPIRGFRSSGSRKSLILDMNVKPRPYELGDDIAGPERGPEHALRALDGRTPEQVPQMAPPAAGRAERSDTEDSGDVFLRIAREEPQLRKYEEQHIENPHDTIRPSRYSQRRPLSTTVVSYNPTSPPKLGRRMSEQEEGGHRRFEDDRYGEHNRMSTHHSYLREKAASVHPAEESTRMRVGNSSRPPTTPRTLSLQDTNADSLSSSGYRRRPSVGDSNPPLSRSSMFKSPSERRHHNKSYYSSSPLVQAFDLPQPGQSAEPHNAVEGTESTASTNAPSTVWDELDDLKSRIHRLELTGKLPSTSAAAVSRLSDERPRTATTAATTMSASPKRTGGAQANDAVSTTSSQKENHPILSAALAKSRPFLQPDVWQALETAANDAMGLSSMMGLPGHPGPISSGASSIGAGGTVTDRQLRRKADSVCRSLTELCVALGEDVAQSRQSAYHSRNNSVPRNEPTTPTIKQSFSGSTHSRRQSIAAETESASTVQSPRAMSKFEERRNTILTSNTLPSPTVMQSNSTPQTPQETGHVRRSSLLVSRTRRAGTEEPEEGRRSSLMLRSRRAGTEDPDEGRATSLLVRNRRGTNGGDDDTESRLRPPSRATTEVYSTSSQSPFANQSQQSAQVEKPTQLATPGGIPRRRFASSSVQPSRLATPASSSSGPQRKYLDRSALERGDVGVHERGMSEDRSTRHMSMGQNVIINRSNTLNTRRNRESGIVPPSTSTNLYR